MEASSSGNKKSTIPIKEKAMQCYLYPPPIARYEDVLTDPKHFMDTLGNFHAAMGTKFMIPIVGGKDLDLHRLFVEVTSRGGIKKVLEEKKWKEVTNSFSFPPSATNASFILRKYYMSLIHHFEQVYYFKAKAWTPVSTDTWQSTKSTLTSTSVMNKAVLPLPEIQMASMKQQRSPIEEIDVTQLKKQRTTTEDSSPKGPPEPPIGFPVTGVIDGKFESGYLCTVNIGGEPLQGVLYQSVGTPSYQIPKHNGVIPQSQTTNGLTRETVTPASTMVRRRRRKKSEMKKRDPAHPKPNRSGYNFFFAEQHARLKPLHPGKDRDISRMIGELWNKLTESEKTIYQEKAVKDKERYRTEMEHYRENLRTGQLIRDAVPLQQQPFKPDLNMELDDNPDNEFSSGDSENYSFEGEEKSQNGLGIVDMETVSGKEEIFVQKDSINVDVEPIQEVLIDGHQESLNIKDEKSMFDQKNEPVIVENETTAIQENESNEKGLSDERRMLDIEQENETKSADNQEKDIDFEKTVEKVTLTSEERVENEPETICPKESTDIKEDVEKKPEFFQENFQEKVENGVENKKAPLSTEEKIVKETLPVIDGESLPSEGRGIAANN